ncbi:AcrR family transcriptional regulator [Nocardiopsis arvandica]|uniref:AcrR family transcriptional regulator n=1 Tax=Nocardiopsis sinuspersici TaxID=501010 RepID=A0A7Y9XFM2_9ACTN|nr:TetR/AcrR family transcriptional regulator [Nocardiopsis sinuspersici]NYH54809.1 AcrR family transcriptional regulator [Nocardiopsis sinuspersici]
MSSTPPTPHEDLTGRARIRDAALEVFAQRGVRGATVQAIAAAAGVSTGLIRHHFGSKEGLREACDAYAIGALLEQARRGMEEDAAAPGFAASMYQAGGASVRYLARALVEGSRAASDLFDAGADLTERFLAERWPDRYPAGARSTRDAAAVMSAMHLGTLVLHTHMSRRMGADPLAPEHVPRIGTAMVGIYTSMADFLTGEQGGRLAESLPADGTAPTPPPPRENSDE